MATSTCRPTVRPHLQWGHRLPLLQPDSGQLEQPEGEPVLGNFQLYALKCLT